MKLVISQPEHIGQRLDRVLAIAWQDLSRSRLQTFIKCGNLTLNGEATRAKQALRLGDVIELEVTDPQPPNLVAEPLPLNVLYEDEHLIVLDKASGMVVHPGAGNSHGTLVHALLAHCDKLSGIGGIQRPGIVHRLDKDTSGCLVAAKDDLVHQELNRQFSDREVRKIYLAVVHGAPSVREARIENAIARHPVNRQKMAVVDPSKGKSAITDYQTISTVGDASLVRCHLHTGRTHQIRVHLHHLGHPLLGDEIYGRNRRSHHAPKRLLLHAAVLGFTHPRTGKNMEFRSIIPDDFAPWLGTNQPFEGDPLAH